MLNITIQNDGKIKIQSECSNTKEMRSNVNLLLAVVSSMEMEEAAANVEKFAKKFDSSECLRVCISKH